MSKFSSKKIFSFFSVSFIILLLIAMMIIYKSEIAPNLFTKEIGESYFLFGFMILFAVGYIIDSNTRKEAGYVVLFAYPFYAIAYLGICSLIGGGSWINIVIILLSLILVLVLGYFIYKYLMPKILMMKYGYQTFLFLYVIIFLTTILFVSFNLMV